MRKFIGRLLIFSVLLFIMVFPLASYKIGGKDLKYIDNPVAALIDKHKRLDSIQSSRLIIMGGSNAFYGMNSARLSDSLHMPVVNMALFAKFGLDFMLKQLVYNARKNDVIVLSIEYFLFRECHADDEIVRYYPEGRKYLQTGKSTFYDPWLNTFKLNIESLQNSIMTPVKKSSKVYVHSRTLNEYGDAIGYLNYTKPVFPDADRLVYRHYEGIQAMNNFKTQMDEAGVKVFFTFPPLPVSDFNINRRDIDHYYADIRKELQIPLLNEPAAMVFNDTLFYDSHYHLGREGREIRTGRLISILKKVL